MPAKTLEERLRHELEMLYCHAWTCHHQDPERRYLDDRLEAMAYCLELCQELRGKIAKRDAARERAAARLEVAAREP
jgi:hypothetical protein